MGITIIIIVCLIYFCIKKTNKNSIKSTVVDNVWKRLVAYELFFKYMDKNGCTYLYSELYDMKEKELTPELKKRLKNILDIIRRALEGFNTHKAEVKKHEPYKGALLPLSSQEEQNLTKLERVLVSKYIQEVENKAFCYELNHKDLVKQFNETMEHFGISEKDLE